MEYNQAQNTNTTIALYCPVQNQEEIPFVRLTEAPSTNLYCAVKGFDQLGLMPELLNGVYAMKCSKPSRIQERAIPLLLADPPMNMIAQSQSGTGKSVAFILVMLQRVDASLNCPQGIIIAPTRELARQLHDATVALAKFTTITTSLVIRQSTFKYRQINEHIVIGTPGSLIDSMHRKYINTAHVKVFVVDEADNMLDQSGMGDQSIRVRNFITNPDVQLLLFSATYPEHVETFADKFAPNAYKMILKREELSVDNIVQVFMDCRDEAHKYEVVCRLYDLVTVSQSIIFCRLRATADEIGRRMQHEGHAVRCLHGGMTPAERDQVIDEFRCGEFKVLISTNVVSRGIDILQVSLVINYNMPLKESGEPDPDTYLHRIGRTGRFGRRGLCVNFVHDQKSWQEMRAMEIHFERSIIKVPTEDWEEVEKIFKQYL